MMTKSLKRHLALFIMIAICCFPVSMAYSKDVGTIEHADVFFSPSGEITGAIVREINSIQKGGEILMLAYSFTSARIAEALVAAHKRGAMVVAVIDKSNRTERYSGATFLANAGVTVLIDDQHEIMHNKVLILNRIIVGTGSFNFTKAGERNAENFILLYGSAALVNAYYDNFLEHYNHSVAYKN